MRAIVLCEGHFGDTDGKTAHGLVRYGERFEIAAVIDSALAGRDAGEALDGVHRGIPIVATFEDAMARGAAAFVIGVATDGGRLPVSYRPMIRRALEAGMLVVAGLHEHLSQDPEFAALARKHGASIEDARAIPPFDELHFFTGDIESVGSVRIAVLGTDSAIGKRTTSRLLVAALREAGRTAAFIGTGQTARMQGAKYGFILDRTPNDYLTGEIEHQVLRAWREERPDFVIIEGQGGIIHPAYHGGQEIILGGRVHGVVLQHAPGRIGLAGFPQYPTDDPERAVKICELMSGHPLVAITLNHENLDRAAVVALAREYRTRFGVPVCDPLVDGVQPLVDALVARFPPSSRA